MTYDVDIKAAQELFQEFQFISKLTPSAQKCAFLVRDADGRDLCLKLISPHHAGSERLGREIRAMARTNHPNVVKLIRYSHSVSEAEEEHYILEEFIAGSDLDLHPFSQVVPWDPKRACDFFAALFEGLSALHSKRVVHRDLKPANIRVTPEGQPVIIDFGLARHLDLSSLTASRVGGRVGTMLYFAPEQWRHHRREIDHRTDLFAVGIMFFHALVGEHPFFKDKMTADDLESAVCDDSPSYLDAPGFKRLPEKLQLILKKLLAKERVDRPANAGQAAKIIRKVSESL